MVTLGAALSTTHSYFEFGEEQAFQEHPKQVLWLAERALRPLVEAGLPEDLSHLVVATTCPDSLAPSLGQQLNELFAPAFSRCHSLDVVQGCAGGVSALILGSQLSALHNSPVMVVVADAARKAVAADSPIRQNFGNGSFACLLTGTTGKGLLHSRSRHYQGLTEVVTVKAGHDADVIIKSGLPELATDPRKHLGLAMNNNLALQLIREAEEFYLAFVHESVQPDVMILHQVNPLILAHLRTVFSNYPLEFIDVSARTGNCGAASIGIAFDLVKEEMKGKKVLLCSFGTGGVITAGLWQN
jgi:3-oxoacyl-[acyl-carrier-protein] synthase III